MVGISRLAGVGAALRALGRDEWHPTRLRVNSDLETLPDLLDGRRLYLSVGHDEYWSWGMRDAVERFVAAGGNAAFLSGNVCFWQVRLEDAGETMVGYKQQFERDPVYGTDRQDRLTSIWSDQLIGRPENHLTGLSFNRGGYHRIGKSVGNGAGGYTVHRPEHWLFEGSGVYRGDSAPPARWSVTSATDARWR